MLRLFAASETDSARSANPCAELEAPPNDRWALAEPREIEHEVTLGETVADVAVRYGVGPREIEDRNGLDAWARRVRPGKALHVLARRDPPPRQRLVVEVREDDTWSSIAIEHRVPSRMLRAYNWHKKQLRAACVLTGSATALYREAMRLMVQRGGTRARGRGRQQRPSTAALLLLALGLPACGGDPGGGDGATDTDSTATNATDALTGSTSGPQASSADTTGPGVGTEDVDGTDTSGTDGEDDGGRWVYSELDDEGRFMIDSLFLFTPQAAAEIEAMGQTPQTFIDGQLDDLNARLERSLVDSSRARLIGYHLLLEEDFQRAGVWPGSTVDNLGNALAWLGDYRDTYGADKFLVVAGTAESGDGFNWGGGPGSSYYVTFLAIAHEFGHVLGGGHCNDGAKGSHFGFPLAGYDATGTPNPPGLTGGTTMCGNNVLFFSNPDLVFDLQQIDGFVADGLMPEQDYAAMLGPGGTIQLGDSVRANMAQTWRDNEEAAAREKLAAKYPGDEDDFYPEDDCAGFFAQSGYGELLYELCDGETLADLDAMAGVSSVQLGRNVHASLYSDPAFGAGSTCGGLLTRLAFSSPSLEAYAEHRGQPSIDGVVRSAAVYAPTDRLAHAYFDGAFDFYSTGVLPACADEAGETVTLIRDLELWTGTAALLQGDVPPPYSIEFEYRSAHEGDDRGDGIAVIFGKNGLAYETQPPPRENLGFIADGSGAAISFNMYTGMADARDGNFIPVGAGVAQATFTAGQWVPVRVDVGTSSVDVYWDGQLLFTSPITVGAGRVGVGAGTGAYSAELSVRDFTVTPG